MNRSQVQAATWQGMPSRDATQRRRDRRLQLRKVFELFDLPNPDPNTNRDPNSNWKVFELFDFDNSGTVGKEELMKVGHARKRLGQASNWSAEQNEAHPSPSFSPPQKAHQA